MQKIRDITDILEAYAPLSLQDGYDNCGFIAGDSDKELTKALITLDLTYETLDEAIKEGCNLIIEHHPTIFTAIRSIDYSDVNGQLLHKLIENKIALYAAHTNVDFTDGGLNDRLMADLGLKNVYSPKEGVNFGRIGELEKASTLKDFLVYVKDKLKLESVKYVGNLNKQIKKIGAINGGGGSEEYMLKAFSNGADIFLSSDFKYHVLRLAKEHGYAIIDIGHYESEIAFIDLVSKIYENKQLGGYIVKAKSCFRPYNFL